MRRDRGVLVFVALFAVMAVALLAAPLYAGEIAHTTPGDNHLTDTPVVVDIAVAWLDPRIRRARPST
jgi:hypothetical protein